MEISTLEKTSQTKTEFKTSVLGAKWQIEQPLEKDILTLVQQYEIPEIVSRVILNRGILLEEAADYLEPTIRNMLPDPFHLMDMEKASERLAKAVIKSEKIAIFGDYDVDGATSSSLLSRFFRMVGAPDPLIHIPDRLLEGYGLNTEALLKLKNNGADIVVTVDCGTVSFEPIKAAKDAGLEVIIIDHHLGSEELPEALALVNPNRLDEASPHRNLAAVGVAFLLAVGIRRKLRERGFFAANPAEPDLRELLDLVALGTVCDVVPLNGVNRAYVSRGLDIMRQRKNKGLAALADIAGLNSSPDVYHLGFILGPRINAGGRVGKSDLGYRLLVTEDSNEAIAISQELDKLNKERQAIEQQVLEEAETLVHDEDITKPFLCVASEGWHPGVIGIVASRLKEKFNRAVAVVAIDGNEGKASVRSVSGVDIGAAITAARMENHLLAGGGHPMAAGFTIEVSKLQSFKYFINEKIKNDFNISSREKILKLDGIVSISSIKPELAKSLTIAAPYGVGNREPRFAIKDAMIIESDIVGSDHVRCIIGDGSSARDKNARLKAVAFRAANTRLGKELLAGYGHKLHIAGKIKLDSWQGNERAELIIEDAIS